ncbi:MAG: hypothetical protein V4655_10570 [Bdellovibrionota bacterium]
MRLRTLFLLFPLLWLFVTGFTQISGHPWTSNSAIVRHVGQSIVTFLKDQNRLPDTLAELRSYSQSIGDQLDLFDNYGNRLFYQPMTETSFFVKSFGRDGAENTVLISKDEAFNHGIASPPRGVRQTLSKESRLHFFQGPVLDGLQAPRGDLYASLQSRFRGGVKRLLIQSVIEKQFFMVSAHDAVEEFVWLPSGSEIVFTAEGSTRYEDGLYYWNLQTNQIRNLLPDFRKKFFDSVPEETKLLLSLSHASSKPDFFYAFVMVLPADGTVDPRMFYRYHNFFAFNPKNKFQAEKVVAERDYSIFDYGMSHFALIDPSEANLATSSQKAWLDLSIEGNKQDLLESWQSYCSTYATSASLPYALWWLASIYNDTYRDLLATHPESARTVRNFALEIVEALSLLPSGPLYIRGFAEHLKKNLLLSKPAAYNVTPGAADAEPGAEPVKSDP